MSKWGDFVEQELERAFPGLLYFGGQSCRPIAGTSKYSQHSWANARDIAFIEYGYDDDPRHQALLDEVDDWLEANFASLSIRLKLWQVPDHFNHIHIDGWPTGILKPPCDGGSWFMRYPDRRVVAWDPGPMNGTDPIEEDDVANYQTFRSDEFDLWTNENIMEAYDAGMFEDPNRAGFQKYWVVERDQRLASEKARFMTDYYAHLWK